MGYGSCKATKCSCSGYAEKQNQKKSICRCDHHFSMHYSTGWCFVTTATLSAIGKHDDCEELNEFRNFRDNWLLHQPGGESLVKEYYQLAPKIVDAINSTSNGNEVFVALWHEAINECLLLIQQGKNEAAKELYCTTMYGLKDKYLN